nr:hypothetical protein [Tanacetum cinerariifolium]
MWKVFVVSRLSWRKRKRYGNFKDQEMDCGACKKLVGEGDMQVGLHDKRIVMQVTLHYEAIVLHDKRIVMQVTLHYEVIVMQVTLHDKRIVMQVTLHYEVIEQLMARSDVFSYWIVNRVMYSPNHPATDIEDAFSSNFPDYTTASPNYFPASPRNISPNPLYNLSKYLLASLAISPFHDIQAYNAVANKLHIPPQDPITSPTILTPSIILPPSLLFDPRYFFVPDELLSPKKQIHPSSSSLTTLSNSSRKQACFLVPPSFLTYTPTPPQIYELGKNSIKMRVKHHEEQIESILNYFEELSFHYIEKIEERLVNGWIIIPRDFDEVKQTLGSPYTDT